MKKLLLLAIIVGGSIAFTSCSKDKECTCADGTTFTEDEAGSVLGVSLFESSCSACGGTID